MTHFFSVSFSFFLVFFLVFQTYYFVQILFVLIIFAAAALFSQQASESSVLSKAGEEVRLFIARLRDEEFAETRYGCLMTAALSLREV